MFGFFSALTSGEALLTPGLDPEAVRTDNCFLLIGTVCACCCKRMFLHYGM